MIHKTIFIAAVTLLLLQTVAPSAADLPEIRQKGVLRHLGVPYANFVTGSGDGVDMELIKLFADYLGVRYEYVKTSWEDVFADLTGIRAVPRGDEVEVVGEAEIKGDVAANGMTILPWRKRIVSFSIPVFPNHVWLVARADLSIDPIKPSGKLDSDIIAVKSQLAGVTIMGKPRTCLDPNLYGLQTLARVRTFEGTLNELVPAVIGGKADATIQDLPDAHIAVNKWPGKIKIIGPVSRVQYMGVAFDKSAVRLLAAFNEFFEQCRRDGTYSRIVMKYYPAAIKYYPEFFDPGHPARDLD